MDSITGPTRLFPGDRVSLLVLGAPPFVASALATVETMEVMHDPGPDDADYVDGDGMTPGLILSAEKLFQLMLDSDGEVLELRIGWERLRIVPD